MRMDNTLGQIGAISNSDPTAAFGQKCVKSFTKLKCASLC
jgi:hypothetical protein